MVYTNRGHPSRPVLGTGLPFLPYRSEAGIPMGQELGSCKPVAAVSVPKGLMRLPRYIGIIRLTGLQSSLCDDVLTRGKEL